LRFTACAQRSGITTSVEGGSRDPPNRLARGESAVQADGAHSQLLLLRERGAPVEVVYAGEGTPLIIAPSAVFKSAPSSNAARLFQSFLLSIETQLSLVDASGMCSFHRLVKEKAGRTIQRRWRRREGHQSALPQHFRRLTDRASTWQWSPGPRLGPWRRPELFSNRIGALPTSSCIATQTIAHTSCARRPPR